ncbi:acyl-CoA carboxylase subunit epsilon [Streptomyces sp. NPDC001480]|uniref:acyl-CoA carboxylase subunit epsilon n=1 Tax=Streptomyces sp. NPDC001480 TaxID=3364577 RepID=UPI003676C334
MGDSDRGEPALRVERGQASDEELAALTVVLLALHADAVAEQEEQQRFSKGSRRWRPHAYRAPRSWQ